MKIIAIFAMTQTLLIGKKNALPWHIPEDLQHFQKLTQAGVVVMGKNTYLSLPEKYRPLPNRRNIVISSDFKECESYRSIESFLKKMEEEKVKKIYLIGGASLYNQFFEQNYVDRVECTLLEKNYDGDIFLKEWRENFILMKETSFSEGRFQSYRKKEA